MTVAALAAPRPVTRGAECHPVTTGSSPGPGTQWVKAKRWLSRYSIDSADMAGLGFPVPELAKIDWLRFTGPAGNLPRARSLLVTLFGATGHITDRGYRGMVDGRSEQWGDTTGVYWSCAPDDVCDWCLVELTGAMLAGLSKHEMLWLAKELDALSFRVTRLDLAVDWRGDCRGMGDELCAGVLTREVVGIRARGDDPKKWKSFKRMRSETLHGEGPDTIYIGQRGKLGSGRYIRFYDKGMQTGTAPKDTWMRFEVEYSDECAQRVLAQLIEKPDDNKLWHGIALGAVDFRENNGQERLARRPRCAWWEWWLQAASPAMAKIRRAPVCGMRKARWMAGQVLAGSAALAKAVGMKTAHEFNDALSRLVEPVAASKAVLLTPAARELVRWFKDGIPLPEYREPDIGWLDGIDARPCFSGGPPG